MASKSMVGGVAGTLGTLIGGVMGFMQAQEVGVPPVQGAGLYALFGFFLGSLTGLFFRSLPAIILYLFVVGVIVYVLRGPMEAMTGIDPIEAFELVYERSLALISDIAGAFSGN